MHWKLWKGPATAAAMATPSTTTSVNLPTMEPTSSTGFFNNSYASIELPQIPSIEFRNIYCENIPLLNLGIVTSILFISIISLRKLAIINKKIHKSTSAVDKPSLEICSTAMEEEQKKYEDASPINYPSNNDTFSTSADEELKPVVFTNPFAPTDPGAPKALPRCPYREISSYNLISRPTPRTERGWYLLAQRSRKGPKSGEKRKLMKEHKGLAKKRSSNQLVV